MNVCLISYSNFSGAGKATVRLKECLERSGIKCDHLFKINKNQFTFSHKLKEKINRVGGKLISKKNKNFKSLSLFKTNLHDQLNNSKYDIIHLTWINEILSIEDIGKINKPVVWTLCDMWPLAGINHYDVDNSKSFWKKKNFNKKNINKNFIDDWIIKRKIKSWKNINIVCPSKWIMKCANESVITHNFKKYHIPWPVNQNKFNKKNKITMRKNFKIPKNRKYILFNAFNGINDPRKGWKIFFEAISFCKESFDIIVIGENKNKIFENIRGRKFYSLGKIDNDEIMSKILNCADLIAIPSVMDNLPQVGIEAQACGLPIVTFDCNGLRDLVDHKINGYLSKPYSSISLAKGIDWTIRNLNNRNLSFNSQKKTKLNWSSKLISLQYKKLYEKILNEN